MSIVLSTLNARFAHASLGLRYLMANMQELSPHTVLKEFVIGARTADVVEKLLAMQPRIIGLGVYIWNVEETTRIVAMLKRVAPDIKIVLGGPEVSYEYQNQEIVQLADYLITGWGETTFVQLCRAILHGPQPLMKVHSGEQPPLEQITPPYALYSAEDLAHRTLYVEASRGCPFKCEFCLSALDKTAWPFELDLFLEQLQSLYERGARQFKFVDRTFNLNVKTSLKILQFFLDKLEQFPSDPVFAHFELVPDHLPEELKTSIKKFPTGSLQFEIGIQSFNPEVQARISRKQNNEKASENLKWLREESQAHLHVDLIAGLPGEDLTSFAAGFDKLVALNPHEIQFGILKRLRGTPIIRHTEKFKMVFDDFPPYSIVETDCLDFSTMQRLNRFARYWDLIANSGRFASTLSKILSDSPFKNFLALSDWLYEKTDATHKIALDRLATLIKKWLVEQGMTTESANELVGGDYAGKIASTDPKIKTQKTHVAGVAPERQSRHLAA